MLLTSQPARRTRSELKAPDHRASILTLVQSGYPKEANLHLLRGELRWQSLWTWQAQPEAE